MPPHNFPAKKRYAHDHFLHPHPFAVRLHSAPSCAWRSRSECELQESVAAVAGCACCEHGCWFTRAAVGFVVGLNVRVGVSRRLREPACGVSFTGAGLWSAKSVEGVLALLAVPLLWGSLLGLFRACFCRLWCYLRVELRWWNFVCPQGREVGFVSRALWTLPDGSLVSCGDSSLLARVISACGATVLHLAWFWCLWWHPLLVLEWFVFVPSGALVHCVALWVAPSACVSTVCCAVFPDRELCASFRKFAWCSRR
ncbi:hypothetical protein Taro_046837 [Colocasia esculenta]|uniref:Uncharacterized protein n=1 Tax=Colocasia esculenta TaxID=4460 RepID=A0A843WUQ7_COLES|nr:hypothetical protein [Colocasia esculenta]